MKNVNKDTQMLDGKKSLTNKICKNKNCKQSFIPNHSARLYCKETCRISDKSKNRNEYRIRATAVYKHLRLKYPNVLARILTEIPDF